MLLAPEDAELHDNEVRLHQALARLDDEARTAVVMHFMQGLSYEAMEVITHIKSSTLRSRVFYALRRLRAHLGETP